MFGHDVARDAAAVRQRLGVVFQSPSVDDRLTCRENLACHARLYRMSGKGLRGRIEQELTRAGLGERFDDMAGSLSGGLRRRLEIAKAVLPGPELVLMDEPDTGLDVAARRRLWEHIADLRSRGVTVVVATHLMDHAQACDRVAIVHEGRLLACDTPEGLRSRVAGDIVTLELDRRTAADEDDAAHERELAAQRIAERFGPFDEGAEPRVVARRIRFEHREAASLIPRLIDTLELPIASLTLGRPTLEDAFVHLTGRPAHEPDGA